MIALSDVCYTYPHATEPQLVDIDLTVKQGECVVLAGASGCGKTTLTRVLNGLAPQFYGGHIEGSYTLGEASGSVRDALTMPIHELGSLVASVFQDPRSQFFATNTTDEVTLGMENIPLERGQMRQRIAEMRSLLGIERLLDRDIFSLSSGEKQRLAVASAATMLPQVIVLDEPSANLDAEGIAHLATLLGRLKERGITCILSEHRLYYLRNVLDRLVVLDAGRVVHDISQDRALALDEKILREWGLRSFKEERINVGATYPEDRKAALFAQAITFPGNKTLILDEVSFSAQKGSVCAIVGENGAGKSSLACAITGILRGTSGSISLRGQALSRRKRIRRSFFVQQDADYQLYASTVADEFLVGKKPDEVDEDVIKKALADVGLQGLELRHPLSLSGGQKQRLLLAVAAVSGRELLVFDEPTSGLDGRNMHLTAMLLRQLADRGACVLLITHDQDLIGLIADDLLYVEKGKVGYRKRIIHA